MTRSTSAQTKPRARAERLEARISAEQKEMFQRAAALQGRTLTDFVIGTVHEAAVKTIQDMEIIRLNAEDSHRFAEALLNPKPPNEAMLKALQRHKEIFGGE